MSKFGELLDEKIPILLAFFRSQESESQDMNPVLKDVAAALGDKGKVIKIDVDKNQQLSEALRVKVLPTLMIYKFSEMAWLQSGDSDDRSSKRDDEEDKEASSVKVEGTKKGVPTKNLHDLIMNSGFF